MKQGSIKNSAKFLAAGKSVQMESLHTSIDDENQMQAKNLSSPNLADHKDKVIGLDEQAQKLKDIAGKRQSQRINEE